MDILVSGNSTINVVASGTNYIVSVGGVNTRTVELQTFPVDLSYLSEKVWVSGLFYPLSNPSGFLTLADGAGVGSLNVTGCILSGAIVLSGIGGLGLTTSGQVIVISGGGGSSNSFDTGVLSGIFYPYASNPAGYITTAQTGSFVTTGQTGVFVLAANTGVFITTGQTGQFAPAAGTGNFITTGQTGVFALSANTGSFVTTGQTGLFASAVGTGAFITTGQTGTFYASSNPSNFTATKITGQSVTGANFTGLGTVAITYANGIVSISGTAGASANTVPLIMATYNIASGDGVSQFIGFAQSFASKPNVAGSIINNSGDPIMAYVISGISTSGFYLIFSEITPNNNYAFSYLAMAGSGLINVMIV
jgi:hypothetical protein